MTFDLGVAQVLNDKLTDQVGAGDVDGELVLLVLDQLAAASERVAQLEKAIAELANVAHGIGTI